MKTQATDILQSPGCFQATTLVERIAKAGKSIADLQQQFQEKSRDLRLRLQESHENLLSQIDLWEEKYLLAAPVAARASFFKFWSDNQFVSAGDEVLTIATEAQ